MIFTNGEEAKSALARIDTEKLIEGIRRGRMKLVALGDPYDYAGAVNYTVGHPEEEMRETTRGRQFYSEGFARLRVALETAMVDTYQELCRRGVDFDISGIRMTFFPDWQLPPDRIR